MMQTRLAIIDLVTGDQPLYEPGGAALVANAEIYNYIELRARISGRRVHDSIRLRTAAASLPQARARLRAICAACMRLRCTIRQRGGSCWRATRSASSRSITPRRANGFAFASEPHALIAGGFVAPRAARGRCATSCCSCNSPPGARRSLPASSRVLPGETLVVAKGRIVERRRIEALPDGGAGRASAKAMRSARARSRVG